MREPAKPYKRAKMRELAARFDREYKREAARRLTEWCDERERYWARARELDELIARYGHDDS